MNRLRLAKWANSGLAQNVLCIGKYRENENDYLTKGLICARGNGYT